MSDEPANPGDVLLAVAQRLFCESQSPSYVPVPVLIGRDRLWNHRDTTKTPPLTNPLVFLTGVWDEERLAITEENIGEVVPAAVRSLSLVVAEYGMGKSELMRQLSTYLIQLRAEDDTVPEPLPVDLAWCRERKHLLDDTLDAEAFWELVGGGLCQKAEVDPATARETLRGRLRRGEVMLILDGLDELILDPDAGSVHHKHFFEGLVAFAGRDAATSLRIVVSMRLEYLLALTSRDAHEFAAGLRQQLDAAIDFVELGFFTDGIIRFYLEKRKQVSRTPGYVQPDMFFDRAQGQNLFIDMLRRPLYLRLFCDLLDSPNLQGKQEELLRIEHVAELFEKFIEYAAHYEPPSESDPTPDGLPPGQWSVEKLAAVVLEQFDQGQDRIPRERLAECVLLEAPPGTAPDAIELARQHYLHKCPFLQRAPRQEMRFAHRAFLEVLTAQGIALALAGDPPRTEPFDNLVANVDMRKFLTYFVEKYLREKQGQPRMDPEKCYVKQTRRGNAMDGAELDEWEPPLDPASERWAELERHREQLLLAMIRPESPPSELMESILWFLDHEGDGLHPRYLMYNYEAVAVTVRYRWWATPYKAVSERLSGILERRLGALLKETTRLPAEFLLIHRVVDIARRLRYDWVVEHLVAVRQAAVLCPDAKSARRILNVVDQIEQDARPLAPPTAKRKG